MKPCLFSVSYAGFWGQKNLDLAGFIVHAAELGYGSVMVAGKRPHASPLDLNDEALAALRATLDRTGVECSIMAAYTDFGGTTAAEIPYLEMQIACVESLCRIGQQLGASVCRVFTAYEIDGVSPHATWKQTVNCLQEVCDRAAEFGITIAVQNHHDIAVQSEALLELLHDIGRPNCKLGFDAWSLALRGEQLYDAARMMAPHTVITTNADYLRLPRFRYRPELISYESTGPDLVRAVPFGEGFIDYEAFFSGLKAGGFDGLATYEMCSPVRGGGSMENLDRHALTYLNWMGEHGFV
jgi:sugar phosphate isomerase/epimerase